jgi:hypothetical protein
MIAKVKNIHSKTIAIFLIVVVGIFALNEYLYLHKHICKDGIVVIHAHPFNKSTDTDQNKSHEHTTGDLVFMASLEVFIPTSICFFTSNLPYKKFDFSVRTPSFYHQYIYLINQERGPPIFA